MYLQALAINAGHARSFYVLGLIAHQTGDFELAVRVLRNAIAISPNDATYHFSLAGALQAQRKPEESLAEYRRALALKPDFVGAAGRGPIVPPFRNETRARVQSCSADV